LGGCGHLHSFSDDLLKTGGGGVRSEMLFLFIFNRPRGMMPVFMAT
jgi:hypothetical protein